MTRMANQPTVLVMKKQQQMHRPKSMNANLVSVVAGVCDSAKSVMVMRSLMPMAK